MSVIVATNRAVLLVGGGAMEADDLRSAHNLCDLVVAVDGGADRLWAEGIAPDWAIGDFDSISEAARTRIAPERQVYVGAQDTTDFEKALDRIRAPCLLCLGFTGQRIDHELAAYNALARRPDQAAVIVGAEDICFHARDLTLDLPLDMRVSLFPMAPVTGRSEGLEWPIEGLHFAPDGRVGTSNRAVGPVRLRFDGDGMLVILPKAALGALWAAWGLPG